MVGLHALQELHVDWSVKPGNIPLTFESFGEMVLKIELCNFFDDIIMRLFSVHHHTIRSPCDIFSFQFIVLIVLVTRSEPVGVIRGISIAAIVIKVIVGGFLSCHVGTCCLKTDDLSVCFSTEWKFFIFFLKCIFHCFVRRGRLAFRNFCDYNLARRSYQCFFCGRHVTGLPNFIVR